MMQGALGRKCCVVDINWEGSKGINMIKKTLGSRMKNYEKSTDFRIIPRTPIIIRIDGKGFLELTKKLNCEKPYDERFASWMKKTSVMVAEKVQGCVFAYLQSDEITFVIRTDQSLENAPWFDNRIQKVVSIISSVASVCFNKEMSQWWRSNGGADGDVPLGFFDCRAFPVPSMMEVVNCLVWRQRDCVKTSINEACQIEFNKRFGKRVAKKMLQNKKQNQQQDLLLEKIGIDWNKYCEEFKNGIVTYKGSGEKWETKSAPIFVSDGGKEWLTSVLGFGKFKKEEKCS